MPHRKRQQNTQHQDAQPANEGAAVLDLNAYRERHPAPDPAREPFSGDERAFLRMLIDLGPERIIAAVKQFEHLRHACPTARRELKGSD